jgi:hypothetical protein
VELVRLQEDSVARQEARKVEIQAQIEAERRATEKYRVRCMLGPILALPACQMPGADRGRAARDREVPVALRRALFSPYSYFSFLEVPSKLGCCMRVKISEAAAQ